MGLLNLRLEQQQEEGDFRHIEGLSWRRGFRSATRRMGLFIFVTEFLMEKDESLFNLCSKRLLLEEGHGCNNEEQDTMFFN